MTVIYFGHVFVIRGGHCRAGQLREFIDKWIRQSIVGHLAFGAMFCVDTFFFIGGFLAAYRLWPSVGDRGCLGRAALGRLTRVFPSLALVVLACVALEVLGRWEGLWTSDQELLLRSGPTGYGQGGCLANWWQVMFLTGSVTNKNLDCGIWLWYLSNDFLFFLLGGIILFFVGGMGCRKSALSLMIALVVICSAVSLALTLLLPFPPVAAWIIDLPTGPTGVAAYDILDSTAGAWMREWYVKPWHRFSTYGIGMTYALTQRGGEVPLPLSIATGGAVALLPVLLPSDGAHVLAAFWAVVSKPLWGVALGESLLRVRRLIKENRGLPWVIKLMTHPGLQPLARLSFGFYLWHPIVLWVYVAIRKGIPDADDFSNLWEWVRILIIPAVLSLAIAAVNFAAVEMPLSVWTMRMTAEKRKK